MHARFALSAASLSTQRSPFGLVSRIAIGAAPILAALAGPAGERANAQHLPPRSPPPSPAVPRFDAVHFAVIGDYGLAGSDEASVSALVHAAAPDFIITTGDNNYFHGASSQIDDNIGQYWHDFIAPYTGRYGVGAATNRFFPSLGNHDWVAANAKPYIAYFTLPGNERYYDFVRGPVHFFAVDSDPHEPDGITSTSVQALWLRQALANAGEPFKVVYFHHAAYSSGALGSTLEMRWPFKAWGASLVLAGHDHIYERVVVDGLPYVVVGLGGVSKYAFGPPIAGSALRYNADYGALFVDADAQLMTLKFVTRGGFVEDEFAIRPPGVDRSTIELVPAGSTWRYRDDGSDPGVAWREIAFDDSAWSQGPAQLGYGDGDEATVVSFGPDPKHKFVTTYFRRTFQVADPNAFSTLELDLLRDDGAVAYLNGQEVFRSNMPSGAIGFGTFAATTVGGAEENTFYAQDVALSRLLKGANTLAVEVHQANLTSSDISFDLRLVGQSQGAKLVSAGATWKYLDTSTAPAPTWNQVAFDDSTWSQGPAQLGYGDGDEATVVSFGPDPRHKPITTWFRKSFTLAQARAFKTLLLRLIRDDGAVVYLNGVEIFRQNVPSGALAADARAELAIDGADESTFLETFADPRLLVVGANEIAVEIHQDSPASPDMSFDLELIGL